MSKAPNLQHLNYNTHHSLKCRMQQVFHTIDSSLEKNAVTIPKSLEDACIKCLPSTAYYIPNFISLKEEQLILNKISAAPKPRWRQLAHRRLQTWPSDLIKNTLPDAPLPCWLIDPIISRLSSIPLSSSEPKGLFSSSPHKKPNHVLINEYPPGVGIFPHKDGSVYHPIVCTVSLGSSLCLDLYHSSDEKDYTYRILQEPRSLLITTDLLYTDYLHGIADTEVDENLSESTVANWSMLASPAAFADGINHRSLRTSLTYRDVLKVSKLGGGFGLFKR